MWHDGLKKHRLIRGETHEIVQLKAQLQADEWDARWSVVNARQRDNADRLNAKSLAAAKTADAQQEMERLESILRYTLNINDAIDWEGLKDKSPFPERRPAFGEDPVEPQRQALPREPQSSDLNYLPQFSLLDKLFTSRRERIKAAKQAVFEADLQKWKKTVADLTAAHAETTRTFEQEVQVRQEQHRVADLAWQKRKNDYSSRQLEANAAVDRKRAAYESLLPEAVIEYCDLVLSKSDYPDYFPQEFELSYDSATKALVVDYVLPSPDALPTLKAVKYVASRDEIEEQHISDGQAAKLFDDVLYQTVLRTLHELFESDTVFALSTVVINGIVTAISQSTGKPVTSCVLSLRANRDEFLSIDLARVDPKTCFKALKGVGSSKLYGLSPVAPIMPLRREDGRFVSAYEVASTLDASVNLAAMDWEDFEHLIREVFEQEFSSGGGEVKVTQASRDGGVDAIAFDPDPIRGGKIVIQAKRYTNTVGVAAVRDLYGTVLNEERLKAYWLPLRITVLTPTHLQMENRSYY